MNAFIIIYFGLAALCLLMVIGMVYYAISHIYSYIKDHRKKKDEPLKDLVEHYKEEHAKEFWIFIDEQYKKECKDKICEFCGTRVNPNASTCPFCKQKI